MSEEQFISKPNTPLNFYLPWLKKKNVNPFLELVAADLVSGTYGREFVRRVFDVAPGVWQDVLPLCIEAEEVHWALERVEQKKGWPLRVAWIDYPQSIYNQGYSIIVFYFDPTAFGRAIVYYRQMIVDEMNGKICPAPID